jgi:hypothetical protein
MENHRNVDACLDAAFFRLIHLKAPTAVLAFARAFAPRKDT